MTNRVREKHIDDILRKLILSTGGLDLSVKHTPGGYTLYFMNGTSELDTVAFGQSRGDIYRQIKACVKVIVILREQQVLSV